MIKEKILSYIRENKYDLLFGKRELATKLNLSDIQVQTVLNSLIDDNKLRKTDTYICSVCKEPLIVVENLDKVCNSCGLTITKPGQMELIEEYVLIDFNL